MRKVTFRFPDETSLIEFAKTIEGKSVQIRFSDLTLSCTCEDAEVELAVHGFHAEVINKEIHLD